MRQTDHDSNLMRRIACLLHAGGFCLYLHGRCGAIVGCMIHFSNCDRVSGKPLDRYTRANHKRITSPRIVAEESGKPQTS